MHVGDWLSTVRNAQILEKFFSYIDILSHQKLGTFLENKVLQKLKFSKNVHNEKCAPKIKLFNEIYQSNPLFHSLGLKVN